MWVEIDKPYIYDKENCIIILSEVIFYIRSYTSVDNILYVCNSVHYTHVVGAPLYQAMYHPPVRAANSSQLSLSLKNPPQPK